MLTFLIVMGSLLAITFLLFFFSRNPEEKKEEIHRWDKKRNPNFDFRTDPNKNRF